MFKGNLTIRKHDATYYEIIGYIQYQNQEVTIKVTEGFLTDGASVPHYLWGIVGSPFEGKYTESAVIHDSLYGSHLLTKEQSDDLFLEMMKESKVSWHKRYVMYYAVKYFGGSSWNKPENKIKKVRKYVQIDYSNTL